MRRILVASAALLLLASGGCGPSPLVDPLGSSEHAATKPFTGSYIPIVAIPADEVETITHQFPGGPGVQGNVVVYPGPAGASPNYAVMLIPLGSNIAEDTEMPNPNQTDPRQVLLKAYHNYALIQNGNLAAAQTPDSYYLSFPPTVEFGWHVDTTNVTIGTYDLVLAVAGTDANNNPGVSVMAHRVYVEH